MAWNGMVLGFEYGAANCAARGRELLGLSGVPEGALDGVSAKDAMEHCGRVHCAAQGRELLGLSGVPEGALDAVSAEDAMAHTGRVLGFEYGAGNGGANLGKKYKRQKRQVNKESSEKRGSFWWSPQLIDSFDAAVKELGGVNATTATPILQKMIATESIPALTLHVVNKRLQNARNKAKKLAGEI